MTQKDNTVPPTMEDVLANWSLAGPEPFEYPVTMERDSILAAMKEWGQQEYERGWTAGDQMAKLVPEGMEIPFKSTPPEDAINENAKKGYVYVGTVEENEIWKKKTEPGGWAYYVDCGWEITPLLWDTTIFSEDHLELIFKDIKTSKQ